MTYSFKKLAEVAKNHEVQNGFRGVRIIQKNLTEEDAAGNKKVIEKHSYYTELPVLTENFVQAFIAQEKGFALVREYVESLQDKIARAVICERGRSVVDADLTIDALIEIGEATSENVRLTKDSITKAWNEGWANRIAYALVLERSAAGAIELASQSEMRIAAYWMCPEGQKFQQIAANYKGYILRAAERKPAFESVQIKDKIITAIGYLDSDILVDKMKEKLVAAPIASVDELAL
jgi:hypothetical protein